MRRVIATVVLLLACSCPAWVAAEPQLIANAGVEADTVSLNDARVLFMMRRSRWPDGQPVAVFVLHDGEPLHQSFCKEILHIYPRKLRLAWERQVYSGTGQAPINVTSEQEMLRRVGSTPGAVGYYPGNPSDDSVKVLQIR
jgi:hypothetical protein